MIAALTGRESGPVLNHITLRVISLTAIVLLTSLFAYGVLTGGGSHGPPTAITITNAALAPGPGGTTTLRIQIQNTGMNTVSLSGHAYLGYSLPLEFVPDRLAPGQVAIGSVSINQSAVRFDGLSAFATVPSSASVNSSSLTLEIGMRYESFSPDQQMIVDKGTTNQNSFYFYNFRSTNNINDFVVFSNGTRYDQQLGDIFTPGVWYSVDFTLDGKTVNAYVNGLLVGSWPHAVRFNGNPNDILLGKCDCGGYFFNGSLSFLRLYDKALSSDEISQNFDSSIPQTSGLVLSLGFNQTAGNIVPDSSGWGNDATLSGNFSLTPLLRPCSLYPVTILASSTGGSPFGISQTVAVPC